jgi:hypothetical protein
MGEGEQVVTVDMTGDGCYSDVEGCSHRLGLDGVVDMRAVMCCVRHGQE